ncbi:MAG TPA: flavodoxin family protein [Candidatus Atribacteria bacterium]|nr:flavodoxin family protein [Candidatus Atribacteria bacterium]
MKIIGISCSPRPDKATHFAITSCLETIRLEFPHIDTDLLNLAGLKILGCIDCGHCTNKLECILEDDFLDAAMTIADPKVIGIIIASPVYFGNMSSQAKAFLDRCVMLRRNGVLLKNKVGGAIAVGGFRNGGQETTIQSIHAAMLIQEMVVVGDGNNTFHFGGTIWSGNPEGYKNDLAGFNTVKNLARRVTEIAIKIHQ